MTIEEIRHLAGPHATEHAPLGARTTYRSGGTARVQLEVASLADLEKYATVLADRDVPLLTVGNGSNLLVADREFAGVVLRLGEGFSNVTWRDTPDGVVVDAGAALDLPVVARRLAADGVVGFEWAVGVPGTIGGAVAMNAGGHGGDMAGVTVAVTVWRRGQPHATTWTPEQLAFGYRTSALTSDDVVTSATLRLRRGDPAVAATTLREIVRWRREHQPGGANAGSVFRNPDDGSAGELIERAGCKGRRRGSAFVSDKHANFIQLDDGGPTADVVALMREVRDAVHEATGVWLRSEIRTVGFEDQWP